MKISIAVCTWNRANLLARTLKGMTRLTVPVGCWWELIVVDNACTDDTSSVVGSFQGRLPLKYVREEKAGLSNARNRAVAAAEGDYLLWTDDDVTVSPGWLDAYFRALCGHTDAVVLGGPVIPDFEGKEPWWLAGGVSEVSNAFALVDHGEEVIRLDAAQHRLPVGANYCIRTDVQRRIPYDPNLGRKGTSLIGGEEIAVVLQALSEHGPGWWIPSARVNHFVPRSRQSLQFLFAYFAGHGRTMARIEGNKRGLTPWTLKGIVVHGSLFLIAVLFRRATSTLRHLKKWAFYWGYLREGMEEARSRRLDAP